MLQLVNVCKQFKDRGLVTPVLKNLNLSINPGEFACFIGPSGSGKTTILRIVGGYEKATKGEVLIDGKPITGPGPDRVIVFQGFDQLFSWKTVKENIEFPLQVLKFNSKERKNKVDKYLNMVGLKEFAHFYPHQLSGGMKQRVALARSMAVQPDFLLMDEPFANLDALNRKLLQKELLTLWTDIKATVLFVTHDIEEAILLADKIFVVSDSGNLSAVINNTLNRPRTSRMDGFIELWECLYNKLGDKTE